MIKTICECDCCGKVVEWDRPPKDWVKITVERSIVPAPPSLPMIGVKDILMCGGCYKKAPEYLREKR